MTIVSNNNSSIKFTLSNQIQLGIEDDSSRKIDEYVIEMPIIKCDNMNDAINLQKEINTFVSDLITKTMREKG